MGIRYLKHAFGGMNCENILFMNRIVLIGYVGDICIIFDKMFILGRYRYVREGTPLLMVARCGIIGPVV